ncbi:MAG TPA: NAD(P)/FAD-dependent oxidoreductase [Clostridiales bacterium]|nr:NAD(P)/FAD-dependent oxidoreductase [Clostridiales bacterium]
MPNSADIIIVGGGPAGLSAAMTARNRAKSVIVISNPAEASGLYKAERVDNYPGLPQIKGADIHGAMLSHALALGAEFITKRVISAMPSGNGFFVSAGADFYECRALIVATGIVQSSAYPGEKELLGRGVSYCATCDGMLYRGKKVAVIGLSSDAEEEADFLRGIGCEVLYFNKPQKYQIIGGDKVEALSAAGTEHKVEGVFILRNTLAVSSLLPGIEMEDNHIKVGRDMSTSVPGLFAAGDCTGRPYQIAKAVGEGNVAALSAVAWLDKK